MLPRTCRNGDRTAKLFRKSGGIENENPRKIAEALQVSTDWILRADTPGTAAVLNRDIERILDGLSADELNDVMLILTDIKRSIKRAKCIAKRYGDN